MSVEGTRHMGRWAASEIAIKAYSIRDLQAIVSKRASGCDSKVIPGTSHPPISPLPDQAESFSNRPLSTHTYKELKESSEGGQMIDEQALLRDEQRNNMFSPFALHATPVIIHPSTELWKDIHTPGTTKSFVQSTMVKMNFNPDPTATTTAFPRSLATREVLTCVALFAYSTTPPYRALAAHVDLECQPRKRASTTKTKGDDYDKVEIRLVGGHSTDETKGSGNVRFHVPPLYSSRRSAPRSWGLRRLDESLGSSISRRP
ncbi:hypothetical protein HKX48_006916 [Thoreauomyces humboldtii]|nr:hypothetical protein HKX48_006916 [Thoreauomyces humboldtii]